MGAAASNVTLVVQVVQALVAAVEYGCSAWEKYKNGELLQYAKEVLTETPKSAKNMPTNLGRTTDSLRHDAQKKLGLDATNCYNYGFAGNSGVGKSSLVNAIRGLNKKDKGAALTGITEETVRIKAYPHPEISHIVLWDIPGCSAQTATPAKYFERYDLYCFDCLIVVIGDALQDVDILLAREAAAEGVDVVFVKSKSDQLMKNCMQDDHEWTEAKKHVLDAKRIMRAQLDRAGFGKLPLFLLSTPVLCDVVRGVSQGQNPKTEEDYKQKDNGWIRFDEAALLAHILDSVRGRTSFASPLEW